MSFIKQSSARHRAETTSHMVRNTAVATAAAGVAVAGIVTPAQATPGFIDFGNDVAGYEAYMSSLGSLGGYTYQAPAPQSPAADSSRTAGNATAGVSTQSNASASGIVGTAYQGLGGSYVWGGTGFKAWDCSGFTQWVYAQHGIDLPRMTWDQFAAGTPTSNPQPGDLVSQNGGSHVGIYIGNGQMISALNPSQGTQVHAVNAMSVDGYYTYR